MTDGGALPIAFSRSVAGLCGAGWLAATVTVGQAFGGDLEAVNLHTGLLAAAHVLHADVAIVAQGPGNLGTGSPGATRAWRPARRSTPPRCLGAGGRLPARVPGRPETASSRHLPPQPDGIRAGGHGAGGPAGPLAGRRTGRPCPGTGRGSRTRQRGPTSTAPRSTSPAWWTLWPQARCRLSTMGRGLGQDEASFVTLRPPVGSSQRFWLTSPTHGAAGSSSW
jgi:hypothetical protein